MSAINYWERLGGQCSLEVEALKASICHEYDGNEGSDIGALCLGLNIQIGSGIECGAESGSGTV